MRLALSVQYAAAADGLPTRAVLRRWVKAALEGRRARAELTVRVVNETEGAALNERWRARRGPTNVLSFPAEPVPGVAEDVLGDIVICAPVVEREAREQRKALEAHWAHLVVHGCLHLLGYDHQRKADAKMMEETEATILAGLGYTDPYRVTARP